MHPQMQLLVALQDLEGNIRDVEDKGKELKDLGFTQGGLDDLKTACDELATKIEPRIMNWYKRLTGKFGHGVVPVVGNRCTGCFANIPTSFISKTNVDKVQKCESCGRFLYWP